MLALLFVIFLQVNAQCNSNSAVLNYFTLSNGLKLPYYVGPGIALAGGLTCQAHHTRNPTQL